MEIVNNMNQDRIERLKGSPVWEANPVLANPKLTIGIKDLTLLPLRATPDSNAYDLRASDDCWLAPGDKIKLTLDLRMALPKNIACVVLPRSSAGGDNLALANTIGLVDSDFRERIFIKIYHQGISQEPIVIHKGDRIAQCFFTETIPFDLIAIDEESFKDLCTTSRIGGDGSTGIK